LLNPKLRKAIIDIKKRNEQIIDDFSQDKLISTGYDAHAKEESRNLLTNLV
jgi:hypothetical protein